MTSFDTVGIIYYMRTGDRERKFGPLTPIPEGLVNSDYEDNTVMSPMVMDEDLNYGNPEAASDDGVWEYLNLPPVSDEETLFPPESFTIVEQTIRNLANGTQLVDIVVEIDSPQTGVTYELRVAKYDN